MLLSSNQADDKKPDEPDPRHAPRMVYGAGSWLRLLDRTNQRLRKTNETHYESAVGRQICKATNMFGTPNHLYDCGKIDHRCPFWWIGEPAPLLFESVDQQCAISYAARADKKFQKIDGASFFHPASPHIDEISSFYFFGLGGSMAAP